ncbi:unnamed protein product, partial [Heterotrigona itama]
STKDSLEYKSTVITDLSHCDLINGIMRLVVRDRNGDPVLHVIYESQWYNGPLKVQPLYVMVLRKCLNPPMITGGGLIPLNLDSFVQ